MADDGIRQEQMASSAQPLLSQLDQGDPRLNSQVDGKEAPNEGPSILTQLYYLIKKSLTVKKR